MAQSQRRRTMEHSTNRRKILIRIMGQCTLGWKSSLPFAKHAMDLNSTKVPRFVACGMPPELRAEWSPESRLAADRIGGACFKVALTATLSPSWIGADIT